MIVGAACLAVALVALWLTDPSPTLLPLLALMLLAGTGLLALTLLRAALAPFRVTGIAATAAAGAIMVGQYLLLGPLTRSGWPEIVSLAIAVLGGLTLVLAGVYWLKAALAGRPPGGL